MRRVALGVERCGSAVNIIAMLPVVQRSARWRAAAPAQNSIATKAKRR
jgi:hypothetical protein